MSKPVIFLCLHLICSCCLLVTPSFATGTGLAAGYDWQVVDGKTYVFTGIEKDRVKNTDKEVVARGSVYSYYVKSLSLTNGVYELDIESHVNVWWPDGSGKPGTRVKGNLDFKVWTDKYGVVKRLAEQGGKKDLPQDDRQEIIRSSLPFFFSFAIIPLPVKNDASSWQPVLTKTLKSYVDQGLVQRTWSVKERTGEKVVLQSHINKKEYGSSYTLDQVSTFDLKKKIIIKSELKSTTRGSGLPVTTTSASMVLKEGKHTP